jgi:hypothetical protein
MGSPKVGKSCSVIATCPGPVYVINCDDKGALQGVARRTKNFEWDLVRGWNQMQVARKAAKEGVAAGKYKTVVLDTLSAFAAVLEEECLEASNTSGKGPDGRRAYPEYERRLRHVIEQFLSLPCNFIAISHYLEVGGEIGENGTPKTGDGIVPLLAGKARATIPMMFHDIIFMDILKGRRVFVTGPQGAWGPGCRSLDTSLVIDADIGTLMKEIHSANNTKSKSNNTNNSARNSAR